MQLQTYFNPIFKNNISFEAKNEKLTSKKEAALIKSINNSFNYKENNGAFAKIGVNQKNQSIFKGPMCMSKSQFKKLYKLGVQKILVTERNRMYHIKALLPDSLSRKIDVEDYHPESMRAIRKTLEEVNNSEHGVYICCATGCGRSAAISAYYLEFMEKIPAEHAKNTILKTCPKERQKHFLNYYNEFKSYSHMKDQNYEDVIRYFHKLPDRVSADEILPRGNRLLYGLQYDGD